MMRAGAAVLLALFAVGSFTSQPVFAQSAPSAAPQVPLMEPATLHGLMASGIRLTIVDVRQPDEFGQGHIKGAVLMPLDSLSTTYANLPKTGKLVVYCRSGHRSGQAVQFLLTHGYKSAVSLHGGYTAWTAAHYN